MGWAHEGAVMSSTIRTTTWTRAAGLGGGGLESTAAYWADEVPMPTGSVLGLSSGIFKSVTAVPGPGSTVAALELPAKVPVPTAGTLESGPPSSGGAGTKMESDSGEGLTDGLRRR